MDSEIKAFYNETNVLITGGTGLLGQLLVEKLLRTCGGIKGIYLILRGKKGKCPSERLLEACNGPLFDKLRQVNPEFITKVHAVEGDCSQLKLGLDESNRQFLINTINIVFHCSASMNFHAELKNVVNTNIRGLSELVQLCRLMTNLKSTVVVSTAYSNCIHKVIEEKFYKAPLGPDTIIKLVEEADTEVLESITTKLKGKWPNIYCYSKAISEEVVCKNAVTLPLCLFRPSIVLPTYSEPVPGWTCNIHGPIGIHLAVKLGILRVSRGDPDIKLDVVPADLCTNALICTAWEAHLNFKLSVQQPQIYNYSGGENRNISLGLINKYCQGCDYPLTLSRWPVSHWLIKSEMYCTVMQILMHHIPAYIVDSYLWLTRQNPRMIKIYEKISKATNALKWFMCEDWIIMNDNIDKLWDRLNETDKTLFPFHMDEVDYENLVTSSARGLKLYILKQSLQTVEEDHKLNHRYLWHYIFEMIRLYEYFQTGDTLPSVQTVLDSFILNVNF